MKIYLLNIQKLFNRLATLLYTYIKGRSRVREYKMFVQVNLIMTLQSTFNFSQ